MTQRFAGNEELTAFLLTMSGLEPCRILELSTGEKTAREQLLAQGFFAEAMAEADTVLHTGFPDGTFDAILSEGSMFLSEDPAAARKEAARLLRQGGLLLLADGSRLSSKAHVLELEAAGFQVLHVEDATELWGGADVEGEEPLRYLLTICEKK